MYNTGIERMMYNMSGDHDVEVKRLESGWRVIFHLTDGHHVLWARDEQEVKQHIERVLPNLNAKRIKYL